MDKLRSCMNNPVSSLEVMVGRSTVIAFSKLLSAADAAVRTNWSGLESSPVHNGSQGTAHSNKYHTKTDLFEIEWFPYRIGSSVLPTGLFFELQTLFLCRPLRLFRDLFLFSFALALCKPLPVSRTTTVRLCGFDLPMTATTPRSSLNCLLQEAKTAKSFLFTSGSVAGTVARFFSASVSRPSAKVPYRCLRRDDREKVYLEPGME